MAPYSKNSGISRATLVEKFLQSSEFKKFQCYCWWFFSWILSRTHDLAIINSYTHMFYVICPRCTSICIPILFTNNVSVRCFIVGYHKNIILYIALFLSSPQIDINFWYIHKILFAAIVLCICFLTNLPNGQFKIHARYIASGLMITYCSRTPPKQIIVYLDIPTDYILLANKVTFSLMISQSNYAFTINMLSFVCYTHIYAITRNSLPIIATNMWWYLCIIL